MNVSYFYAGNGCANYLWKNKSNILIRNLYDRFSCTKQFLRSFNPASGKAYHISNKNYLLRCLSWILISNTVPTNKTDFVEMLFTCSTDFRKDSLISEAIDINTDKIALLLNKREWI